MLTDRQASLIVRDLARGLKGRGGHATIIEALEICSAAAAAFSRMDAQLAAISNPVPVDEYAPAMIDEGIS